MITEGSSGSRATAARPSPAVRHRRPRSGASAWPAGSAPASGNSDAGASTRLGPVMATMSLTCAAPALVGGDHHQGAEPQRRMDGDRRRDVVAGEHEHGVARVHALSEERGDGAVDRGVELGVGQRASRSATATRSGAWRAASPTRSTGSVPQYPAARNRAARAATRSAAWLGQVVTAPHVNAPVRRGLPVESGGPGYREACYGQRRVTRSRRTRRPCGRWSSRPPTSGPTTSCWPTITAGPSPGASCATRAGVAADLAGRGVGTGTIVSWQLPTTLETMVVMVALAWLGVVQNPLIPILRSARSASSPARSGPR